jgi:hypothetical protein
LREAGWRVSKNTVAAIMREQGLAWNPGRRVMKVRMSDTELGKPKTIMKVRMEAGHLLRRRQGRDPWRTQ